MIGNDVIVRPVLEKDATG